MFGRTLVKIPFLIDLHAKIERLGAESRARDAEIQRLTLDNNVERLKVINLERDKAEWRAEELALHKSTAAMRAMNDMLRLEVNVLREKEGALLAQLMPTLKMAVPKVETDDSLLAGTDMFSDMGDREAERVFAGGTEPQFSTPTPPGDVHASTPKIPGV
jgi:hypothetical protein